MKKVINLLLVVLGIFVFMGAGFFVTSMLKKPDAQFGYYEQIAQEVFEQGNQFIVECPEDVVVEITATSIKVSSSNGYFGYVNARLKDGELRFERVKQTPDLVLLLIGVALFLIGIWVKILTYSINEYHNKHKKKTITEVSAGVRAQNFNSCNAIANYIVNQSVFCCMQCKMYLKNLWQRSNIMESIKIWTIQPEHVWNILVQKGTFCCDMKKSSFSDIECFKRSYDWLIARMNEQIKNPKNIRYPIWGWYRFDGDNRKMNLDSMGSRNFLEKGIRAVCIELEIPRAEVVLSDYERWNSVLENFFIGSENDNVNDLERIDLELDAMPEDERQRRIENSWNNIFSINNSKDVQATFWELKMEYVKSVEHFISS